MKRLFGLKSGIEIQRYDVRSWSIDLFVTCNELSPLITEFCLLLYKQITSLSLSGIGGPAIVLSIGESSNVFNLNKLDSIKLEISVRDLEFATSYLLSWYRDGFPSVNHIDIPILANPTLGEDATFVVHAIV